jgi:hypothetical protein
MTHKEQKLTKAEIVRNENFEAQTASMGADGFTAIKCSVPILKANLMAFLLYIPFGVVFTLIYYFAGGTFTNIDMRSLNFLIVIPVILVFIVVHEGLHGLAWGIFCKNKFRSIQFGILSGSMTPYCACLEPLKFGAYITGGLMPLAVLGIGCFVVAAVTKNDMLFYWANFNVICAGGDITIALMQLKHTKAIILDLPTECGFMAFEKQESASLQSKLTQG